MLDSHAIMCETCLETGSAGSSWLPLALIRNANVQSVFGAAEEVQICLHIVTSAQNGSHISRCWATLHLWIKAIYKHGAKLKGILHPKSYEEGAPLQD